MYYLFGILLFLYLGFLSAWTVALAARFSSRVMQLLSAFFTSAIQLTLGSFILFGLWQIEYASMMKRGFFVPLAFMLVSNALLLIVLLACGLWRKDRLPNARHWPQGRVLLAALTFAFLAAISYGTIDHSIEQFLLEENTHAVKRLREIYARNIPEAQNAANIYREIGPLLESKPVPKAYVDWIAQLPRPADEAVFSDPAVLAYHEQIEPLLEKGRQAAELPSFKCMRFVYDSPITSTLVNPRDDALSHARNIASGWDFSARLKMSQGNVAGAIREVAAMRLLSKQLAQEPDVLNHSVAFEVGQKGEMIIAELTQRYELKESDLALLPKHLILEPQAMELAMEAREQEAVRMVIASHLDYRMVLTNGYGVQGVLPQAAVEIALSLLRVLRAQEDIGNLRHLMEENREPLSLPSWKMIAEAGGGRSHQQARSFNALWAAG